MSLNVAPIEPRKLVKINHFSTGSSDTKAFKLKRTKKTFFVTIPNLLKKMYFPKKTNINTWET